MNKQFNLKLTLAIALFFSASSLVYAQDFINRGLEFGEIVEFESSGVKYKLFHSAATNACFLLNMLTQNCIIKSSQKYSSICLVGDFVVANKYGKKKKPPSDIYNLDGKLLVQGFNYMINKSRATKTTIVVENESYRLGLLNIDGSMLLQPVYNTIKIVDPKNKTWEITSNDGVYIYDENTRKLSQKDGKEIIKAKLPEIKGYEFIVNYDFKEDSKMDIRPTDCLVKELAENLWFVVDVENSKSGIYSSTTNKWVVKPNYGIKLYSRDKRENYTPQIVEFSLRDGGVNYYKELLADAFNATNELKGRGFYVINHNDKNSQTKKEFYKKVGQCIVFDENKVLAEIPFYVNNTLTKKLWDINKTTKILVVQDVVEFQNVKHFGLANRNGEILFKPKCRELKFINFGQKSFVSFYHYYENESILELINDDEAVVSKEYELISSTSNGNAAIAKKQGLWGMIDKTGKLLLPFEYDRLYIIETPYISAVKYGKSGVFDDKGEEVIPFISYKNIVNCYGDFYSTGVFGVAPYALHYCQTMDSKVTPCSDLNDKVGNYIGTYSRIQKNANGSGVFIFDEYKKISRVLEYDKKTGKTIITEDSWASWKKINDEYGSGSSAGSMAKDWMEATKGYLTSFENFKRACDNFIKSTSNSNKKELQYWLDDIYAKNNYIVAILNHPNDKSLTAEELSNYRAIANQKKRDLNKFQEQLNNGVYTVLDALLYNLK